MLKIESVPSALETVALPTTKIVTDRHQYRGKTDDDHVERICAGIYANPDLLDSFPLIAIRDGNRLELADGHHRYTAALLRKLPSVPVIVYTPTLSDDDDTARHEINALALRLAGHYNAHSDKPMHYTRAEKRELALAALRNPKLRHLGDSALAQHLGGIVDNSFLGKLRKQRPELQSDVRTGRDGRTTDISNIGKKPAPAKPTLDIQTAPPAVAATLDIQTAAPAPVTTLDIQTAGDAERAELMDYVARLYPTAIDTVPAGAPIVEYLRECVNIAIDRATAGMVPAPAPKPAKTKPAKPARAKKSSYGSVMGNIDAHDGTPASLNQLLGGNMAARRKTMSETEWAAVVVAAHEKNLTTA